MLIVNRRRALGLVGIGLTLPQISTVQAAEKEKEVPAVEDLMREHGVLRRALLVYTEAASRLTSGRGDISTGALHDTADLFRTFGEEYHERAVEERHVFPTLVKAGGENAALSGVLKEQHDRGREITAYIATVSGRGRISPASAKPFSDALTSFVRMYAHHAAIEDTVIFPAWKAALSESQYHERSEQFEELEQRMLGKDGFEEAVKRIEKAERAFGLADLAKLTAPPPPKSMA